jgi:hypothetical protein
MMSKKKKCCLKAEVETLRKQVDLLSRGPYYSPRAQMAKFAKAVFPETESEPMAVLLEGFDRFDMDDPDERQKAFSKAVSNMIAHDVKLSDDGETLKMIDDPMFARTIFDQRFHGGVGRKLVANFLDVLFGVEPSGDAVNDDVPAAAFSKSA